MRGAIQTLWNARRGRRLVVSMVGPLVAQSQKKLALSGRVWIEPYIIGFLAMLITYVATRRIHSISSDTLALIQAETWQELTGQDPAALAEEAIRLSLTRDPMFEAGCRNAAYFGRELFSRDISDARGAIEEDDNAIDALWEDLFEGHVAESQI